jgi:hypothetical protein
MSNGFADGIGGLAEFSRGRTVFDILCLQLGTPVERALRSVSV